MEYLKKVFTLENVRLVFSWLLSITMIVILFNSVTIVQSDTGKIISSSFTVNDILVLFVGYIISHGEFSVKYTKDEK